MYVDCVPDLTSQTLSAWTWGNLTWRKQTNCPTPPKKKKKINTVYLQGMDMVLLMFLDMMWLLQQPQSWDSDWHMPITGSSVHLTDLTLLHLHTSFPFLSESWVHTVKRSKPAGAPRSGEQIPQVRAVGPLRNKNNGEKARRSLLRPRCKLYSVPNKNETGGTIQSAFAHVHTHTHTQIKKQDSILLEILPRRGITLRYYY